MPRCRTCAGRVIRAPDIVSRFAGRQLVCDFENGVCKMRSERWIAALIGNDAELLSLSGSLEHLRREIAA